MTDQEKITSLEALLEQKETRMAHLEAIITIREFKIRDLEAYVIRLEEYQKELLEKLYGEKGELFGTSVLVSPIPERVNIEQ